MRLQLRVACGLEQEVASDEVHDLVQGEGHLGLEVAIGIDLDEGLAAGLLVSYFPFLAREDVLAESRASIRIRGRSVRMSSSRLMYNS